MRWPKFDSTESRNPADGGRPCPRLIAWAWLLHVEVEQVGQVANLPSILRLEKISHDAANSQAGIFVCRQLQLVVWVPAIELTAGFSRASWFARSPAEAGSPNKAVGRRPPTKAGGKQHSCGAITTG